MREGVESTDSELKMIFKNSPRHSVLEEPMLSDRILLCPTPVIPEPWHLAPAQQDV